MIHMQSTGGLSSYIGNKSIRRSSSTTTTYKVNYDENGKPKVIFTASGVLPNGSKFSYYGGNLQKSVIHVRPSEHPSNLRQQLPPIKPKIPVTQSTPKLPIINSIHPFEREVKLEEISVIKQFTNVSTQPLQVRKKLVKSLMLKWHPDKHPNKNLATRIFQFIASRKSVLLEESDKFD